MKKKLLIALLIAVLAVCSVFALTACNPQEGKTILYGKELVRLTAQVDILTNLENGSADIGVMDSIMAGYYATKGGYADKIAMVYPFSFEAEEYGIGAKKGNDALIGKINEGLIALAGNGTMETIAEEYGVENETLVSANASNPNAAATDNSWSAVVASKKLVIGYTVFAPIAYTDTASGKFIGYDVELAEAIVTYLNETYSAEIEIEWQEIVWDSKQTLLENGTIDLVWNGMTLSDQVKNGMSTSIAYLANKQTLIVRKADAAKYNDIRSFLMNVDNAIVAVEGGSAADLLMTIKA